MIRKRTQTPTALSAAIVTAVTVWMWQPNAAHAQDEVDFELPTIIKVAPDKRSPGGSGEIDLRNIVQSAARRVTTVQEAPAIVTVITSDEILDRGFTDLEQALDSVPGWMRLGAVHSQFPFTLARGQMQAMMYMKNGVSLFDANFNVPSIWRLQPMETIKRIEVVTGPGGVLWGANSFLGIVNVITKDADDVDGVEAGVRVGDGNGDRSVMRGYAMAGFPDLLDGKAKLFVHTSFETYHGPGYSMPWHMFSQALPQPNSQVLYGPLRRADPPRSFLFNFDGKLSMGDLNIYFSAPFVERHTPLGFPGYVVEKTRAEDYLTDMNGNLLCEEPPAGTRPAVDPTGNCLDQFRRNRDNRLDWFERYLIADYGKRFAGGKAGINLKGYFVQFNRDFRQLGILKPIQGLLEGGLAFRFDGTNYRAGGQIDSDIDVTNKFRVLLGAEAFHEWLPDNTDRSLQGGGTQATFLGPYNLGRLPLPCPIEPIDTGDRAGMTQYVEGCPLTFAFDTSRTVMGAYLNPQYSISKKLVVDAGARVQIAPESMGGLGYPLQTVFSGAAVWGFADNWHLKLNYAEGFRPPVFNNTISNGDGIEIGGDPNLQVENSQAGQVEVNARLFRGAKRIREFNFRADYSYSRITNLIQINGGIYQNSGARGIHSAEFLGKLYLRGGHRVELAYTWLKVAMEDKGWFVAMPEHWFHLTGVFALSNKLRAMANLRIVGAMEDPNRIVEYRDLALDDQGRVIDTSLMGSPRQTKTVWPHEMVMDRLPPGGDLTLGLSYLATKKLTFSAFAYNALNQMSYQPDAFHDYEPRLEFLPNPNRDFRFILNAVLNM